MTLSEWDISLGVWSQIKFSTSFNGSTTKSETFSISFANVLRNFKY